MNRLTPPQQRAFCYAVAFAVTAFDPAAAALGLFLRRMARSARALFRSR